MTRSFFPVLVAALVGISASAAASEGHAPRVMAFETGIRQCVHESFTNLDPTNRGLRRLNRTYATALFEFGWQLGGLTGRPAVVLSIPIQISWAPAGNLNASSWILSYGWTLRHDLLSSRHRVVPFLGYGLLLDQFFAPGVKGHVIGHETRFDLGADVRLRDRVKLFLKVEYSMMSFYAFGRDRASMGVASLKTGIRF